MDTNQYSDAERAEEQAEACTHDCSTCSANCSSRGANPEDFRVALHELASVKKVIAAPRPAQRDSGRGCDRSVHPEYVRNQGCGNG